jgi:DNA repair protein RadA/Sms
VSRSKPIYYCTECGIDAPQWTGWCPGCDASGTLVPSTGGAAPAGLPGGLSSRRRNGNGHHTQHPQGRHEHRPARALPLPEAVAEGVDPVPTDIAEVDRVLGGGLLPGSVTLLGGEPGIGKSTLLLQVAAALAARGRRCVYVAAEESEQQVATRAQRLGVVSPQVWLAAETSLPPVLDLLDQVDPDALIIDSVQSISHPELGSAPGSLAQVRGCAQLLVAEAKTRGLTVIVVGHITKEGALAGPKVLEHLVDTVLSFEGERHHALRLLRATKHRFGGTRELGLFEMRDTGLWSMPDPSSLFLADRHPGIAGSVVAPVLDGQRPLLVEVQALVVPSQVPVPRRSAQGIDNGRLSQVLAVLERRAGVTVSRSDVHVAVVGGIQVREPGVDLAVALAVASSQRDIPLPADLVACGELGLGGELRQVQRTEHRLAEVARLGFHRAVVPRSAPAAPQGLALHRLASVGQAVEVTGLR